MSGTVELRVVDVVRERAARLGEAVVSRHRREHGADEHVEIVYRVVREEERQASPHQVGRLLEGVHREARPDARVVGLVVERVHVLVQPRQVQPPVDEVEVEVRVEGSVRPLL